MRAGQAARGVRADGAQALEVPDSAGAAGEAPPVSGRGPLRPAPRGAGRRGGVRCVGLAGRVRTSPRNTGAGGAATLEAALGLDGYARSPAGSCVRAALG